MNVNTYTAGKKMLLFLICILKLSTATDLGYYVTSFLQEGVVPGRLLTFDTVKFQTSNLTTEYSNKNSETDLNGTIITITTPGVYGIQVQMTWDIDGGVTLWSGPDIDNMTESVETVGSSGFYDLFTGSFFVAAPSTGYKIALGTCSCNLDSANMRSHYTTDPTRYTRPTMIIRSLN